MIRKLGEQKFGSSTKLVCVDDMRTQRFVSFFNLSAKSETTEFEIIYENANTYVKSLVLGSRDVIINLAAITDAEASVKKPDVVKENNFVSYQRNSFNLMMYKYYQLKIESTLI